MRRLGFKSLAWLGLWAGLCIGLNVAACSGQIGSPNTEIIYVDGSAVTPDQLPPTDGKVPPPDDQTPPPDQPAGDGPPPSDEVPEGGTPEVYFADMKPFLETFCINCHGGATVRAKLEFYSHESHRLQEGQVPPDFWLTVYNRVKVDENMPPAALKPTSIEGIERFNEGLRLLEAWKKAGFPEKKGGSTTPNDREGKEDPYIKFPTTATCKGEEPLPARLWRLTSEQLRFSLQDVFGSSVTIPDMQLSSTEKRTVDGNNRYGFSNNAKDTNLTSADVTMLIEKYTELSAEVLAKLQDWKDCLAASDRMCVQSLVETYGKRLWRRPLTTDEVNKVMKGFDELAAQFDRQTGLSYALERLLISPTFLYISEQGTPTSGDPNVRRLTSYEVASVLSFYIWQSVPDDALMQAAEQGKLQDMTQISAQIDRMLQDEKSKRGVMAFFNDWMKLRFVLGKAKDTNRFPEADEQLKKDMDTSTQMFLEYMIWTKKASLDELLTSQETFVNANLASVYSDITSSSPTMERVTFDNSKRRGLLTSPAFMFVHAGTGSSGFVHRGVFFLEEMTCYQFPEPPPADQIQAALEAALKGKDLSKMTQREIQKLHAADPGCNSCHRFIDPVGSAFEIFDPLGRFRSMENNKAIDPVGDIEGRHFEKMANTSQNTWKFNDALDFIDQIVPSDLFKQCFAIKLYTYSWGRRPEGTRNCALAHTYEAMKKTNFSLLEMYKSVIMHPQFFLRQDKPASTP